MMTPFDLERFPFFEQQTPENEIIHDPSGSKRYRTAWLTDLL
jgi:hypothetical protein